VPAAIEPWKVQEVRRYLAEAFPGARLDDYPRGGATSHLFVVREPGPDPRRQPRHHLLVTRQFFDRFADSSSLRDALECGDIGRALVRAGDRTVDLY